MRTVANILQNKAPQFNYIEPHALVIEALQHMNSVNMSYLIVKDEQGFHGIFSERDYSRNVILKGRHSDSCTVREVMSTEIPIVGLQDTVEQCMQMLNNHKTRYLLIFNDEQFEGVVTINDVLREALANKEMIFDELLIFQNPDFQDRVF